MRLPFAVYDNGYFVKSCEDSEGAETTAVAALRAGRNVEIRYLRRPLVSFTPADFATVVNGQEDTFLIKRIDRAVEKLGRVMAAPRGKNKQAVVAFLVQYFQVGEGTAMGALDGLRPYLK